MLEYQDEMQKMVILADCDVTRGEKYTVMNKVCFACIELNFICFVRRFLMPNFKLKSF